MNLWTELICRWWEDPAVAKKHVKVNQNKILDTAYKLSQEEPKIPDWKDDFLPKDNKAFVSHLLYITAVDFGTFNLKVAKSGLSLNGSRAIAYCFYEAFGEKPVAADQILEAYENMIGNIELYGRKWPLINEDRMYNLKKVARVMQRHYKDDVMNLLEESGYKTDASGPWNIGVVELLKEKFPGVFGQDYVNEYLRFDKRARLFALIYQGRALNSGGELRPLQDMEKIGPIIDYRVPNALRYLDILEYSPKLVEIIDNKIEISRHSPEEIEIRAAATYAIMKLLGAINDLRDEIGIKHWTMMGLDYHLWNLGQTCGFQHHITITTDY